MDWKQILSLSFDELTDLKRDEIYEDLINLKREHLDRKHHKKLIDLMQHILKYKGDIVSTLLTELEGISAKDIQQIDVDVLLEKNAQQNDIIQKLEADKTKLKLHIKELSEDNVLLQRRNQDSSTMDSEREDSPNLLSELDKQEELLLQINQKNKQIKGLLRDIETLEAECHSNHRKIQLLETGLKEATHNVSVITSQLEGYQVKLSEQAQVIEDLNLSVTNLNDQIGVMERERTEREGEIQVFGTRLEERAVRWRQLLQEKDDRLDSLKTKYEVVLEQNPGYDIDTDREGLKRLTEAVTARDHYIADLEEKISDLSREMTDTTELLNRLAKERETVTITQDSKSICPFCNETNAKMDRLSVRYAGLQEIVSNMEEENMIKSKEALQAQKALASFESGEDGLTQALARIVKLQSKIESRDKHVRSLIMELNTMQTCTRENEVLRQRLGISEEEIISTSALSAKQRKQEKHNKRLELKLRASEEIRLQLKLDNHGLRKQLGNFNKTNDMHAASDSNLMLNEKLNAETHTNQELSPDHLPKVEKTDGENSSDLPDLDAFELRYAVVVEENENLRIGMHEILEQLRNYDAQADHIVIDTPTLEKLLHALDARSISGWYHPAMRMQNELIAAKERELALIERLRLSDEKRPPIAQRSESKDVTHETVETVNHETNINLDAILQHITDQETEINAIRSELKCVRNDYMESMMMCDQLKEIERHFKDLTNLLSSDENDQMVTIARQSEKLVQLQNKCNREELKVKFIKEEYDELQDIYMSKKDLYNRLIFELRKHILERQMETTKNSSNSNHCDEPITDDLKQEISSLKTTLGRISASALHAFVNFDEIKRSSDSNAGVTLGVIQDDFTLHFISEDELNDITLKCTQLANENVELKNAKGHMEELLRLTRNEIQSHTRMLNKRSEDEIASKHLIVDLQSESQEKYIIAKMTREINKACATEEELRTNIQDLKTELAKHEQTIQDLQEEKIRIRNHFEKTQTRNDIKLRFLSKSYADMRQNFHQIVPLYPLLDFMKDYAELLKSRDELRNASQMNEQATSEHTIRAICEKVEKSLGQSNLEDKLLIIKYESHQAYLEEKVKRMTNHLTIVHEELDQLKLRSADWTQHWNTIDLLFGQNNKTKPTYESSSKETQASINKSDKWTNTDAHEVDTNQKPTASPKAAPRRVHTTFTSPSHEEHSLASQLKQAMYLASARSALLLEHESRLAVAHARVKTLEKIIEERDKASKVPFDSACEYNPQQKNEHILSVTITSLQNLLHEKDSTLNKYQEILQTERQNVKTSYDEHCKEITVLQTHIDELQSQIRTKDKELKNYNQITAEPENLNVETAQTQSMPDTMLEEMFLDERTESFDIFNSTAEMAQMEKRLKDSEDETRTLRSKLREVSLRETVWERSLFEKDNEICGLNERLHQMGTHEADSGSNRRDIDQLREMLDEKDRHINDLTDTLTHFHDDQQKFLNDTTLHSAEQVSQLSADLNRYETTNRILNTQLEALKRQLSSVGQREGQAREVIKTLKTQLIRRPVISLKTTDRSTTSREEQLQKRVHNLDNELQLTREELRKHTAAAQYKRSKDAAELDLWSKQKRFQQIADTLKQRLVERENELDKVKGHLATSKTSIARLEREKNTLNDRLSRMNQPQRYCNHPSCPTVHLSPTKRASAESPDSYGASNHHEFGGHSGQLSMPDSSRSRHTSTHLDISDNNQDIVDAQRSRIESQHRKILVMEMEGRGASAMGQEIERLQEKLSSIEAQNIRLEAKNLHLQLNNDMLQQSDQSEKDKRQIKHLEEYIIALKSELTQTQSQAITLDNRATSGTATPNTKQLEQTILAMRRVVERLKAENKNYKEAKIQSNKEGHDKLRIDFGKVQQSYSEALDKISALQIELEIQTGQCVHCKNRIKKSEESSNQRDVEDVTAADWRDMKEKLIKKTQLLEKAKILLGRAAAKEKQFREQIAHWKRRCSELQNVPIIEEEPTN